MLKSDMIKTLKNVNEDLEITVRDSQDYDLDIKHVDIIDGQIVIVPMGAHTVDPCKRIWQ
ncbi:hypothetical protein LCGC14_0758040 [marine sediment metagenome]|uniref:Uncharacterized protein n=1 Tax=marine sediment metagenome TaxID=412755 RepID=A0A0F9QLT5_9ZZZZ